MNTRYIAGLPPCRPKIHLDEWIETYLFRVARANGIHRPRLTDIERFRPTLPTTALSKPDGYPIWSDSTLPRWSVVTRVNKIRYCPECMTQSRYIRSRWRLRMFDVCTIHHVRLKDDLAEPVMTKGYRQDSKYFITEATDEQLWAGAVCPMPNERRHVERLWASFERSIIEDDVAAACVQLTYILFLEALLDAVAATTHALSDSPIGVPRSTELAELAERYQFPVAANLDGIWSFLNQVTAPSHRIVVLARLRRMLIDEARGPTCLSNLPIGELRRQFLRRIKRSTAVPERELIHPSQAEDAGYFSFERAGSLIGCPTALLKHLVYKNICQGAQVIQYGGRRNTFLPPETLEACCRWYASVVTPEQVMRELCIDRRGFVALVGAHLLRPIARGRQPFFQRSDLTDLCRRLKHVSRPIPKTGAHLQPLLGEWIPVRGRFKSASLEALKEACSGELSIFRRPERPGLSAYFIDHTALECARRIRKGEIARQQREKYSSGQLSLLAE